MNHCRTADHSGVSQESKERCR